MNIKQHLTSYMSNQHYPIINLRFAFALVVFLMMNVNALAEQSSPGFNITSPVSGIINKVFVSEGQMIKKGDLLLEYETSLIKSQLSEVQAKINLTRLNQSEAKKELARAEELYDRTVLSEQELQQAKISYRVAMAQYARAKNKLTHTEWYIKHSKLYAAFSGTVVQVLSYSGQYVNNQYTAQTLFIIKPE